MPPVSKSLTTDTPDYIEQVFNEGRQEMQEGQSPLPRKDYD